MDHQSNAAVTWYFDYVSPFAYLQFELLQRTPLPCPIEPTPVLFAGLLGTWGQLGPAEIPPKRVFTYQHTAWLANRLSIPLNYPPGHPFNSLPMLRATIASANNPDFIRNAFRWIWQDGQLPVEGPQWQQFLESNGIDPQRLNDQAVKDQLRESTSAAATSGVFGVPTACVNDQLFWGVDALEMLRDYLTNPQIMHTSDMQRLRNLPKAAARKQAN